jgi:predicted RNase H-like HicB family nuclease
MLKIFDKAIRTIFKHQDPSIVKRKYGIPNDLKLNIQLSKDGWFIVTSPDLPGLVTQAASRDELIEMLNDAVLSYFDVPKRDADVVYNQLNLGEEVIRCKGSVVTRTA